MSHPKRTSTVALLTASLAALCLCGCGHQSETDKHSAASSVAFGSPEWNKAAAEDISVRIMAVLQRPSDRLSWSNESEMLQLTTAEKDAITKSGVTGELEVVYTTGRGSGSREVRVVIIQTSPLSADAVLPVPETGSFIYIQDHGSLKPLFTNSVASTLKLEIYQQKPDTVFFMDYPRDGVRSGGSIFWWDENGKWHML
jgi:hypothetical protein